MTGALNNQHIILVDDSLKNIRFLGTILRSHGARISIAQNGTQALATVNRELPDLILLDIMLPDMDGYEICTRLKKNSQTRDIPVIFMSALSDPRDKTRGFLVGGVDYVTKPIEQEELLARINAHLTIQSLRQHLTRANLELEDKITQRTREIAEKEERFRSLVETVNDCIWEIDSSGCYTYVSPKIKDILGYSPGEMTGKTLYQFIPPEDENRVKSFFRSFQSRSKPFAGFEIAHIHQNGRRVIFEINGTPILDSQGILKGYRGVNRDITRRKQLEQIMIQTEKMMSVGGLAAGMAHEINNPLAGIIQNVQVLQNRIKGNMAKNEVVAGECGTDILAIQAYAERRGIVHIIKAIYDSSIRAAKIVENMLSFSKKSNPHSFEYHDIGELMDKTLEICAGDYDLKKKYDFKNIKIIRQYDRQQPRVYCEPSEIQQVFMNILKNGAQAMGLNHASPCFIISITAQDGAMGIAIQDNGLGMDESTAKRVFEPFFTTKGKQKGTGLGLSVSYFIIKENHKGTISVSTTPGRGSNFTITLPLSLPDKPPTA